jgi:hypothetical protein
MLELIFRLDYLFVAFVHFRVFVVHLRVSAKAVEYVQ